MADYRAARAKIGLVPQELTTDAFETRLGDGQLQPRPVRQAARTGPSASRLLRDLSLWDKKDGKIMTLSGGMKRRVMIAKALSHEPQILFLDEPTAGVDVELRRDMWDMVRGLRASGVTIILTTHYIEEAEEMADRIGVINKGELILVEDKAALMQKARQEAADPAPAGAARAPFPTGLAALAARTRRPTAAELVYTFDAQRRGHRHRRPAARGWTTAGIDFKDLQTEQSSLEDIFVSLVSERTHEPPRHPRHLPLRDGALACAPCCRASLAPVISTSLYFVVFGAAIGSRMAAIGGVSYGAFIVPGLIMLSVLTESISNASFGIYMPEVHRHDLRAALRAGVLRRGRPRLCRRGGDQVGDPGR